METLKNIAFSVAAASLLSGALILLAPSGKQGGAVRYILCLTALLLTLSPFSGVKIDPDFETDAASINIDATEMLRSQSRYIIGETLRREGVSFRRIEVYTDISDGGGISISSIVIFGASPAEKAKKVITENFGVLEVKTVD